MLSSSNIINSSWNGHGNVLTRVLTTMQPRKPPDGLHLEGAQDCQVTPRQLYADITIYTIHA